MFGNQGSATDSTSEKILHLIHRHEELVAKRESLLELQQRKNFETDKRKETKENQYLIAKKRNQKILDELLKVEKELKDASLSMENGKLVTLKEHYMQSIQTEFPNWLEKMQSSKQQTQ